LIAVDTNVLAYAHVDTFTKHAPAKTALGATRRRRASMGDPGAVEQHWPFLLDNTRAGDARGNLAFDAAIAAICQEVGVTLLLTEDRDFDRFAAVAVTRLADFDP
jgi:predicted nucleic acid-binding protein